MELYQPLYIFLYFILLGIIYIPVLVLFIRKYTLDPIGIVFTILSVLGYIVIAVYMQGAGYYADENDAKITIGLSEMVLLAYPYLFIILAAMLGGKSKR